MKVVDQSIEHILKNVLGDELSKEVFNKVILQLASEDNMSPVLSLDGYVMFENDVGEVKIAIPTRMIAITRMLLETSIQEDKLIKELSESIEMIKMINFDEERMLEKNDQSQTWKKSNQRHPAFKR